METQGSGPRRPPELRDVYRLLRPRSHEWNAIGMELGVDFEYRESLLRDGFMRSGEKLETVLNRWIQSLCSEASWDNLIEVLEDLEFIDMAKEVKSYLQNDPEAIRKYNWVERAEDKEKPVGKESNEGRHTEPELRDVHHLLIPKSHEWQRIGKMLGVDFGYRENLLKTGALTTDEVKLEGVLIKWIESQCSEVSWDHLIEVLEDLEFTDMAKEVKSYLHADPEAIRKYNWDGQAEDKEKPVGQESNEANIPDDLFAKDIAESSGYLKPVVVVMHSPPGAGKTSVKQLMLGRDCLSPNEQNSTVSSLPALMVATADIQTQWKELGEALGIPSTLLESMSSDESQTDLRHLYEVLRYWVSEIGGSWGGLIGALRSSCVEQEKLAQEVEEKHQGQSAEESTTVIAVQTMNEKPLEDSSVSRVMEAVDNDSIDWKVLGLMLGLSDKALLNIESSNTAPTDCQRAMLSQWVQLGQAYWSVLVRVLEGPVIEEKEMAKAIIVKENLNVELSVSLATETADEGTPKLGGGDSPQQPDPLSVWERHTPDFCKLLNCSKETLLGLTGALHCDSIIADETKDKAVSSNEGGKVLADAVKRKILADPKVIYPVLEIMDVQDQLCGLVRRMRNELKVREDDQPKRILECHHDELVDVLDGDSTTLSLLCGGLLSKGLIDHQTNTAVSRQSLTGGADKLLKKLEQRVSEHPSELGSILNMMEKQKPLYDVVQEMRKEFDKSLKVIDTVVPKQPDDDNEGMLFKVSRQILCALCCSCCAGGGQGGLEGDQTPLLKPK